MTIDKNNIYAATFAFDEPFDLELADGTFFHAEKVVRIIPKKRMVVFGTWQDKMVVAKLFFHPHRANKHIKKDVTGIHILRDNKIPSPDLYYQGISADKRAHVLLLERIVDADNIEDVWVQKKNTYELMRILQLMMIELATQHVLGVLQHDLHLKNFLVTKKNVYTLDGGQIEFFSHRLSKKISMKNVALFLSQLGVGVEEQQEALYRYYAKARGWLVKNKDIPILFSMIKKWGYERWQRYEKKIYRESSDFSRLHGWGYVGMYDRRYASCDFLNLINYPESAFKSTSAVLLKAGRSATVVKMSVDNHEFVIKRYNVKNGLHFLRRCFRSTRAFSSWRLAQKLKLYRIPTATPIAFIEKRHLGLRGVSYYVMAYVPGGHVGDFLQAHQTDEVKMTRLIKRVTTLLKNLATLRITHGDLKITNMLLDSEDQPLLIDLDGAKEHTSAAKLNYAWRKDIKRFLQNFYSQPLFLKRFQKELNQ